MTIESAVYINTLNVSYPDSLDQRLEGDDHLRLLRKVLLNTFPSLGGAITIDQTKFNYLVGLTSDLAGQIGSKATLDSPTFTGVPKAPTRATGSTGTGIATVGFVTATSLNGSLPGQVGNAGKLLKTDGSVASWTGTVTVATVKPKVGVNFANTANTQSLYNTTSRGLNITDSPGTKNAAVNFDNVALNSRITLKCPDENVSIVTPRYRLLNSFSFNSVSEIEIDMSGYAPLYNSFRIVVSDIAGQIKGRNADFSCYLYAKANGAWDDRPVGSINYIPPGAIMQVPVSTKPTETQFLEMKTFAVRDSTLIPQVWLKSPTQVYLWTRPSNIAGTLDALRLTTVTQFVADGLNTISGTVKLYGILEA